MAEYRIERLQNQIRNEIAELIMKGVVKDPRVSHFASIAHLELSRDLSWAKVFISTFEDKESLDRTVAGLNSASGFIQTVLAKKLKLRHIPRCTFIADTSIAEGLKINQLIKDTISEQE